MGLDIVEVVMRCEEHFAITIKDEDAEQMRLVGDLYRLVCKGIGVAPVADPSVTLDMVRPAASLARAGVDSWKDEDIWATVKWIVVEQLQVREDEVTPLADFARDLGAD